MSPAFDLAAILALYAVLFGAMGYLIGRFMVIRQTEPEGVDRG